MRRAVRGWTMERGGRKAHDRGSLSWIGWWRASGGVTQTRQRNREVWKPIRLWTSAGLAGSLGAELGITGTGQYCNYLYLRTCSGSTGSRRDRQEDPPAASNFWAWPALSYRYAGLEKKFGSTKKSEGSCDDHSAAKKVWRRKKKEKKTNQTPCTHNPISTLFFPSFSFFLYVSVSRQSLWCRGCILVSQTLIQLSATGSTVEPTEPTYRQHGDRRGCAGQ